VLFVMNNYEKAEKMRTGMLACALCELVEGYLKQIYKAERACTKELKPYLKPADCRLGSFEKQELDDFVRFWQGHDISRKEVNLSVTIDLKGLSFEWIDNCCDIIQKHLTQIAAIEFGCSGILRQFLSAADELVWTKDELDFFVKYWRDLEWNAEYPQVPQQQVPYQIWDNLRKRVEDDKLPELCTQFLWSCGVSEYRSEE